MYTANSSLPILEVRGTEPVVSLAILTGCDAMAVMLSGYLCAIAYSELFIDVVTSPDHGIGFRTTALRISVLGSLLAPLVLRHANTRRAFYDTTRIIGRTALQICALIALVLTIGFLTGTSIYMPWAWIISWSCALFISAIAGRMLLLQNFLGSYARSSFPERIAVVGEPSITDVLASRLNDMNGRSIEIVGRFQDLDETKPFLRAQGISRLIELCKLDPVDKVLLAIPLSEKQRLDRAVSRIKSLNVDIVQYSGEIGVGRSEFPATDLDQSQMVMIATRPIGQWGLWLKALQDQILSALLIISLAPLMALIAITIKLDSPGPVCYRQPRHGLNNTEFNVLKFRTMRWRGDGTGAGVRQTLRNDPRVTSVGRFLRRSSLDELPQLFNVLRGEMSLVGPRPHPVDMRTDNRLGEEIVENYAHRHRVKPGLTGWAQINGLRGATNTPEQIRRRVEHDLLYIENWSIFLDLKILVLTPIRVVLDRDCAY